MTEASELERVYREQGPRVWRALVGFCGDAEVASDALSEAFAQALAGADRIASPTAWVWRAAFKIAAGELKGRGNPATRLGNVYSLDWSPDGSKLVVAGGGSEPLHLVDARAGQVSTLIPQQGETKINRAIAARGWGKAMQLVDPVWSPSGRYLAALANLEDPEFAYVPVVFTEGGDPVAFGVPSTEFPNPVTWSPTEDLLAYTKAEVSYRITEAHLLDPTSGADRLLSHLPIGPGPPSPGSGGRQAGSGSPQRS